MIPKYPEFKKLSLEDKPLIESSLNKFKRNICELNLANLLMWESLDNPSVTLINNNLCVLVQASFESPYFLEPFDRNNLIETIGICLKHTGKMSRISEDIATFLDPKKYAVNDLRSQSDYIYLQEELASLKGKKYDGKRNHIKKFTRNHPNYQYKTLSADFKPEVLALFEKWFISKKDFKIFNKISYSHQKHALKYAFSHFEALNLIGGAIMEANTLKGFIVGSPLNQDTISLHFSYVDPETSGASQTLLWEACNKTYTNYKFINLEQDIGLMGLRKSKLSYHPVKLERKFEISC